MEYSKILGRLLSIHEKVTSNPRLYMDAFETFDDIPPQHRCFLDLAYWLTQKDRSIEEVPEHARTDRLMFFHLVIKPHRFQSIMPSSKRYYAICEFGLWRTSEVLRFVPVVFITESLVRRLTLGDSRHALLDAFKNKPWFDHLYTKDLIELTLTRSLIFLGVVKQKGKLNLVDPQTLAVNLSESHYLFTHVINHASDHLQQLFKDGFWFEPVTPEGSRLFGDNPRNPAEALLLWEIVCKTWAFESQREAEGVCALKMNCFEDEEVIMELMKTGSGRKFLQKFYSDERVRVLFNSSSAVRGYILEQELAV